MPSDHPRQLRQLPPLDPPMVPVALVGLAGWAIAALVIIVVDGPPEWLRICVAGILLGLAGLAIMVVRDRRSSGRPGPG